MANPVVQTSSGTTATGASSITVTKPTGLAVGDFMFAFISFDDSSAKTFTTPAGWTELQKNDSDNQGLVCYYKEADSGDTAASNFTFNLSASTDRIAGAILRVDGLASGSEIAASELDEEGVGTGSSVSYTTSLAPVSTESLFVACFYGADGTLTGTPSMSTYASTPTVTWTEEQDLGLNPGGAGMVMAVAHGDYDGSTTWTARSASFNEDMTEHTLGIAIVLSAPVNAAGTATLLETATTLFSEASVVVGGNGTSALQGTTTTLNTANGLSTQREVWSNDSKESTNWNNETL